MSKQKLFLLLAFISFNGNVLHSQIEVQPIEFNRDIRPILSENCLFCHGPDAGQRQADLRLDDRDSAIQAQAIIAGSAAGSELVKRILSEDNELLMPPPESNKKLSDEQKQTLQKWIDQGASYQLHWSYTPPMKAAVPPGENAIDYFVRKKLAEVGLKASPQADARILIRRLHADLIGLPPTPQEVADFQREMARDSTAAYAKLVERLLDSPHFGERMALGWLDAVRFADTIGYHSDTPRDVWPYRDWVIHSFNSNKPFDRFTLEQIAGDLLPDASQETRVGSAFNRLLLSTEEGGAQPKDYEARMLTDRVRAVGSAWLGQTTGCAQCHDHKFDPLTSRDFYALGAFFADIEEPVVGRREPGMPVASEEQQQQLQILANRREGAQQLFDSIVGQLDSLQQQWEQDVLKNNSELPELANDSEASQSEKSIAVRVKEALAIQPTERAAAAKQVLQDYFRRHPLHPFKELIALRESSETAYTNYLSTLPTCLVSKSSPNKRIVRLLPRGNWMDESGEVVSPALPHYLPQTKTEGRELTRLDLAQWLVSRDNPLTARNYVNRLWKQFFGMGISRVLDDLGAQGEPPVNAELLDWLAVEFMDNGWSIKHMIRTIVHSSTYQQVSTASHALLAVDPNNRLIARQSAFRLEAELVRDNALSVSGLLVAQIGGPSVKFYQPEGYWENLNFPTREYVPDRGPAQYRRGLYAWWQRSFLNPSLSAFDAPNREECAAERSRSNVPQQALVLLNAPGFIEAARALASRILCTSTPSEGGAETDQRLRTAFNFALQREPDHRELDTLRKLLEEQLDYYRQHPDAAREFLTIGAAPSDCVTDELTLAAWTHVARVLLNLHESITRS